MNWIDTMALPEYPLAAVTTNTNPTTPEGRTSRELANFPQGDIIGNSNEIAVVRTNWEVGIQRTTRASSALIEDAQALAVIARFYNISAPGFELSSVSLTQMPGLTHEERQIVTEYLLNNTRR